MEERSCFNLIGSSPEFRAVLAKIKYLGRLDATVLIAGETGTGKALAARTIHYLGRRDHKPFVPVNCGGLSDGWVEDELFGNQYKSGGLIADTAGGTLFLNAVDALSDQSQAKLLRFIQSSDKAQTGHDSRKKVDVRLLVATRENLDKLAQDHCFSRDLLYHLNGLTLKMPPLRSRGGDALELAVTLVERLNHQYRGPVKHIHEEGMTFIQEYSWPGNVRELEDIVRQEFRMLEETEMRFTEARRNCLMTQASPIDS